MKKILLASLLAFFMVGCNNDNGVYVPLVEEEEFIPLPLSVVDQEVIKCDDDPFVITVDSNCETNVTVTSGNHTEAIKYVSKEEGIKLQYTVSAECIECNASVTEEPVKPPAVVQPSEDGNCPENYQLNDCGDKCLLITNGINLVPINGVCPSGYTSNECNTLCVKNPECKCGDGTTLDENNTCVPVVKECGEGTELDSETGLCEIIPPLECDIGFRELEGTCMPIKYIPEKDEDCIEGYKPKKDFCKMERL